MPHTRDMKKAMATAIIVPTTLFGGTVAAFISSLFNSLTF